MTVEDHALTKSIAKALPQSVAQLSQPFRRLRQSLARDATGLAQADEIRHVLRPGAASAFVAGAVDERLQPHAAADVEDTHPLRRVQLVARDRQQVNPQ